MIVLTISLSLALLSTLIFKSVVKTIPNISQRISPYDTAVRVRLNQKIKAISPVDNRNVYAAILEDSTRYLFSFVIRKSDDEIGLLLKQAGLEMPINTYKISLTKKVLIGLSAGIVVGSSFGSFISIFLCALTGTFITYNKSYALLEKKAQIRKELIRFELPTINSLLAIYTKTGSGVLQAINLVSQKTTGVISKEMQLISNRASTGMPVEESIMVSFNLCSEPSFKRTLKLLSSASNRGVDLAQGLMDLTSDHQRSMREEIKTLGAKKRAAMLLPTIGILAPIMLLFVAAPIPSIVLTG